MDALNSITSESGSTKNSNENEPCDFDIIPRSPKKRKLSEKVNDNDGQSTKKFIFETKGDDNNTNENKDSQTTMEIIELIDENIQKEAKLNGNKVLDEDHNDKDDTYKNYELMATNCNKGSDPEEEYSKINDDIEMNTSDKIVKNKNECNVEQNVIEIDSDDDDYNNRISIVAKHLKRETDGFDKSDEEMLDFICEKNNLEEKDNDRKSLSDEKNLETNKTNSKPTNEEIIIIEENDPETETNEEFKKDDESQKNISKENIETEIENNDEHDDELQNNDLKEESGDKNSLSVNVNKSETSENPESADQEIIIIEENDPETETNEEFKKDDESQKDISREKIGTKIENNDESQNNNLKAENDDKRSLSIEENKLETNENSESADQEIIVIEENDPDTETNEEFKKDDESQKNISKEKIGTEIENNDEHDDELQNNNLKEENDDNNSLSVDVNKSETSENSESADQEIIVIEENDPETETNEDNEKNDDESQKDISREKIGTEIENNDEHDDELQNNNLKEENDDINSLSVDDENKSETSENSESADQEVIVIEENDPETGVNNNNEKNDESQNNCLVAEDGKIKDKESSSETQINESNMDFETNEIMAEKNLSSSDDKDEQKIEEKEVINDENEKIDDSDTIYEKSYLKIDKVLSSADEEIEQNSWKIVDSFTLNTDNNQDIEFNEDESFLNVNDMDIELSSNNDDNEENNDENNLDLNDDLIMANEDNNIEKITANEIKENEKDDKKDYLVDDTIQEKNNKSEDEKNSDNNLEPELMAMSERQIEENDTGYQMEIDDYEEEETEVIEIFDDDDEEEEDNEDNEITTETADLSNPKSIDETKKDENEEQEINVNEKIYAGKTLFYNKDCINAECNKKSKLFIKASRLIVKFFRKPPRTKVKRKIQYCCKDCYELYLTKYMILCNNLLSEECILNEELPRRYEIVEILDSSDEEDSEDYKNDNEKVGEQALDYINDNLDDTIDKILKELNIDIQIQLTDEKFQLSLEKIEDDLKNKQTKMLRELQSHADRIHNNLYSNYRPRIKELPPVDLNVKDAVVDDPSSLPPEGEIIYPPLEMHKYYFATENHLIDKWSMCQIIEISDVSATKYFKVRFENEHLEPRFVTSKQIAYFNPPLVRLPIGSRVIALFDSKKLNQTNKTNKNSSKNEFYPGIVAETMTANNRFRYLVFFDDGYPQYISHKNIRLVCHASKEVWNDVFSNCREFFRTYLTQCEKDRPIVEVKKGQTLMIEINNMWYWAKAVDVDCSIVLMQTVNKSRLEWFYRGSTRLYPVYKEKFSKKTTRISQLARRTEPYIRYMQEDDTSMVNSNKNLVKSSEFLVPPVPIHRSVAKKSVTKDSVNVEQQQQQQQQQQQWQQHQSPSQPVKHLNNSTIFVDDDNKPKGKIIYYAAKNISPRQFIKHVCQPSCLYPEYNLKSYSPLIKPLLSGWERLIFRSKLRKWVVYRGPCGRLLRNMKEVHRYLRVTNNILNVDNFDCDPSINVMAEYSVEKCFVEKMVEDISEGIENMPVPCINYYDDTVPPNCTYSTERIPTEGVFLNLDPEFLVGCDCTDDCSDKTKCSCWQLTLDGAKFNNSNVTLDKIGYSYMRLPEPVPTGIYECNDRCKCSKKCLNRVVQHPLQMKLQVFKTSNRGWGLRCINDIPKGSFICIYAGHLLTEQNANEGGANFGDEYFAELDYIEVVERLKEGYESDVQEDIDSDDEIEEKTYCNDSDEEFRLHRKIQAKTPSVHTRMQARIEKEKNSNDDNDNDENGGNRRKILNYEANKNTTLDNDGESTTIKYKSVRKFFGKDEFCYVMDAKLTGNIGRYFNHSCSPNLFVQNVFVDTHDLRFPWVAFFALHHIRAGTELTWNYNYEVGVVPGKVLYCECGSDNCRGRLL